MCVLPLATGFNRRTQTFLLHSNASTMPSRKNQKKGGRLITITDQKSYAEAAAQGLLIPPSPPTETSRRQEGAERQGFAASQIEWEPLVQETPRQAVHPATSYAQAAAAPSPKKSTPKKEEAPQEIPVCKMEWQPLPEQTPPRGAPPVKPSLPVAGLSWAQALASPRRRPTGKENVRPCDSTPGPSGLKTRKAEGKTGVTPAAKKAVKGGGAYIQTDAALQRLLASQCDPL